MNPSPLGDRMHRLAPGIAAGTALGISDVLAKIVSGSSHFRYGDSAPTIVRRRR